MSHTMKLWERIIEHHFDFMSERSTMEVIFLIKQLMERCRE
jgi:hypothetical protein